MRRTLLLLLLAVTSCQQAPGPAAPTTPPVAGRADASPARAPRDLDVTSAIEQVRRAVRRDGDWLRARGEHHELAVDAAGRFRVATRGEAVAELDLETTSLTLGGRPLGGPVATRAEGRSVVVARGPVEERLENGAAGVEQRWHLSARPAGQGDLAVTVRARGLPYAGATAGGLHFGEPARGALVRYGLATLVDATGRRTPLTTRFAGGAIRITVPEVALEAAAWPAVIDPIIGPERAVDSPPGGFPASGAQGSPAVACLALDTCLVAWQDRVLDAFGGGWQLRAARLNPLATASLDPNAIDLDVTPGSFAEAPQVVATSTFGSLEFLVVYRRTDSIGFGATRRRLMAVRVGQGGTLMSPPFQLSTDGAGDVGLFSAAAGLDGVAVVWSDIQQIRFTVVRNGVGGVATAPFVKPTVPQQDWWGSPAVIWTNGQWKVAWRSTFAGAPTPRQAILVGLLDPSGNPQASPVTALVGANLAGTMDFLGQPVLASNGASGDLMVVPVATGHDPFPGLLMAMRNDPSGANDPEPWPLPVGGLNNQQAYGVQAWWDGNQYVVLQEYIGGLGRLAALQPVPLLATSGPGVTPPLDPWTQVSPTGASFTGMRAALGTSGLMLAWEDLRSGTPDVRAARLAGADPIPFGTLLTTGGTDEDAPAAAYTNGQWLVAWEDYRQASTTSVDVRAARLAQADGAALDPSGLQLTDVGRSLGEAQVHPVAAGGGGRFTVAWRDDRTAGNAGDVYATQVTTSGVVTPSNGLAVTATALSETPLGVAWDGTSFQILHREESATQATAPALRTVRLSAAGAVVPGSVLVATSSDVTRPLRGGLACTTSGCLVAWAEELAGTVRAQGVTGGGLTGGGRVLATGLPATPPVALSAIDGLSVPFLVAWTVPDLASNTTAIKGALTFQDGTPSAQLEVAAGRPGVVNDLTTSVDGNFHVAAWSPAGGGLSLEWLLLDGVPRAAPTTLDSTGAATPLGPLSSASDGEGRTLVAYTVFDATPGVRAKRVRVRLASFAKLLGQACAGGTECTSGTCVEGVCCESVCGGGVDPCQTCNARGGVGTPGRCTPTTESCSDGQACTSGDRCDGTGFCRGTAYTCTATQCQQSSTCDGTGGCTVVGKPDDTTCDDGNACSWNDRCTGGACAGTSITCVPTQCQISSTCNGTNLCTLVNKASDQACNDGNPCTVNDHCDGAGNCASGSAKVCPDLSDPCKGAGACEQASGNCVYVAANEGAPCPGGTCKAGACDTGPADGPGAVFGMSCGTGPGGAGALLLALLALASRRARRCP